MSTVTCHNSAGVLMDAVCQWDANREIRIRGVDVAEGYSYQIHFGNRRSKTTYVLEPAIVTTEMITELVTDIPMELLEMPDAIDIYVYSINISTNEMRTIDAIRMTMIQRTMPQDYVSTSTDGIIKVADGFIYENGTLYLASNGVIIGTGIDINFSQTGASLAKLRLRGTAETVIGVAEEIALGTADLTEYDLKIVTGMSDSTGTWTASSATLGTRMGSDDYVPIPAGASAMRCSATNDSNELRWFAYLYDANKNFIALNNDWTAYGETVGITAANPAYARFGFSRSSGNIDLTADTSAVVTFY